jgi:hypothetical protein
MHDIRTTRALAAVVVLCLCGALCAGEPAATPDPFGDILELKDGMGLPCRIERITSKGLLEFRTAWTEGTATARAGGLLGVTLGYAPQKAQDPSCVLLANGDIVTGRLVGLTDEDVLLQSAILGEVKIPRAFVLRLVSAGTAESPFEKDFGIHDLHGWTVDSGRWVVSGGFLRCKSGGRISLPLTMEGALTVEVAVKYEDGAPRLITMRVDGGKAEQKGREPAHIEAVVSTSRTSMRYRDARGSGGSSSRGGSSMPAQATYRLAYDPATSAGRLWADQSALFTMNLRGPQKCKRLSLTLPSSARVKSIRVRPGMHPPGDDPDDDGDLPEAKATRVVLTNGDTVTPSKVAFADDVFLLTVQGVVIKCPPARIKRLDLPHENRARPRRRAGDARLRAGRACLTLRVRELTADTLLGDSDYLGEVRIPRKVLRGMQFGIYDSGRE